MDLQRVFSVLCFATLLLPCTVLAISTSTTPEPEILNTNETSPTTTMTTTTTTTTPTPATAASNNGSGDGDLGRGIGIGVGIMLGVLAILVILVVIFLWRRGWVLHLRLPCNRASDMEQPLDPPSKNGKNGPKVYTKQTSDEGITNPAAPPPLPSSPPPADDGAGAKHTDLQRSNTYEVPQANYVSERQYEGLTRQTPADQRPTSETPSENYEDPEKVEALQPKSRESRASKQSPGTSAQLYKQFKEDKKKDGRKSAKPAARAPPDGGAAGDDEGPGVMDEFYENCEFDAKNPSAKMPDRQSHMEKAHPTFASEEAEVRAKVTRLPSAPGDDVYMDMDGTGHASGIRPPSMDDVYQNTDEALSTDLKMSFKM